MRRHFSLRVMLIALLGFGTFSAFGGRVSSADEPQSSLEQAEKVEIPSGKVGANLKAAYDKKIALYKKAIAEDPRSYEAHTGLAKTYQRSVFGHAAIRGPLTSEQLTRQQRFARMMMLADQAKSIAPERYEAYKIKTDGYQSSVLAAYHAFATRYKLYASADKAGRVFGSKLPRDKMLQRAFAALDIARCWAGKGLPDTEALFQRAPRSLKTKALETQALFHTVLADEPKTISALKQIIEIAPESAAAAKARKLIVSLTGQSESKMYKQALAHPRKPLPKECPIPPRPPF